MNDYELIDMHGRPVFRRPVRDYEIDHKCPDCGGKVEYAMFEVGLNPKWYWCGECEIGG